MTKKFKLGPYNYCDYRCDRCAEQADCRVYKENQERILQHYLKGEDPNDPEIFLNDLKEIFEKTQKMIEQAALEQGIELGEIVNSKTPDPHNYLVYNLAYDYFQRAHKIIADLEAQGIPETLKEAFEDFVWYHTLLVAKTGRLVSSFDDEFFDPEARRMEEEATLQVIQKGIDLSRNALNKMLNELPDNFQEIVDLLDLLKRLEIQLKTAMREKQEEG
ncbi:MAG: hypothetical protein ABIL39_10195 [candidate division WOR-3 bacterium]